MKELFSQAEASRMVDEMKLIEGRASDAGISGAQLRFLCWQARKDTRPFRTEQFLRLYAANVQEAAGEGYLRDGANIVDRGHAET